MKNIKDYISDQLCVETIGGGRRENEQRLRYNMYKKSYREYVCYKDPYDDPNKTYFEIIDFKDRVYKWEDDENLGERVWRAECKGNDIKWFPPKHDGYILHRGNNEPNFHAVLIKSKENEILDFIKKNLGTGIYNYFKNLYKNIVN